MYKVYKEKKYWFKMLKYAYRLGNAIWRYDICNMNVLIHTNKVIYIDDDDHYPLLLSFHYKIDMIIFWPYLLIDDNLVQGFLWVLILLFQPPPTPLTPRFEVVEATYYFWWVALPNIFVRIISFFLLQRMV